MARVSVLMPVRNARATLAATLESLAAQDEGDFELVLVDDGSDDGSADLARERFPDRLVVLAPGRVGLVGALNRGLAACRAPLVARMDADDLAAPERLRLQCEYLDAHPEVGVVGSQVRCFAEGPLGGGFQRYEAWLNGLVDHEAMMRDLFVESPLAHPSVTFRRELVSDLGGYHERGWPEDYDLWLRAARAGVRFAKVARVLLSWRDAPDRTSRRDAAYSDDAFLRCKAHHLARGPLAGRDTIAIWGAGPIGRRLGRYLRAEGAAPAAFVDIDPRKIGRTKGGAPIIGPEGLPALGEVFVVAAVGAPGARDEIRARLRALGSVEGRDFVCAA